MEDGYLNTRYFQVTITPNKRKNVLQIIKDENGKIYVDLQNVAKQFERTFASIFANKQPEFPEDLDKLFRSNLAKEDGEKLTCIWTKK